MIVDGYWIGDDVVNSTTTGGTAVVSSVITTYPPKWKFCAQCGHKLEAEWNNCPGCGVVIGVISSYCWSYRVPDNIYPTVFFPQSS